MTIEEALKSNDIETVQLAVNMLKNEGKTVRELNEIEISINGRLMIIENWERSIQKIIKNINKIK
jgi:hypothetical protein